MNTSFAFDARIHGTTRREAERVLAEIIRGAIDPRSDHERRTVIRLSSSGDENRSDANAADVVPDGGQPRRVLAVGSEEYRQFRSTAPARLGEPSQVREFREAFVISVVLSEGDGVAEIASYAFPKKTWDAWWYEVGWWFDEASVEVDAKPIPLVLRGTPNSAGTEGFDPAMKPASHSESSGSTSCCLRKLTIFRRA